MKIRLPPELKADIEAASKANQRSMNAEIVARLQASFKASGLEQEIREFSEHLEARLEAIERELRDAKEQRSA